MSQIASVDYLITCIYQSNCSVKTQIKNIETFIIRSSDGGTEFQLVAFVNDVNQDANEGSDGVEHM